MNEMGDEREEKVGGNALVKLERITYGIVAVINVNKRW